MLFCVGNFFGDDNKEWEALKSGQIKGEKKLKLIQYFLQINLKIHPLVHATHESNSLHCLDSNFLFKSQFSSAHF